MEILCERDNADLHAELWYDEDLDQWGVRVVDRYSEAIRYTDDGKRALDMFYHPFVYVD